MARSSTSFPFIQICSNDHSSVSQATPALLCKQRRVRRFWEDKRTVHLPIPMLNLLPNRGFSLINSAGLPLLLYVVFHAQYTVC